MTSRTSVFIWLAAIVILVLAPGIGLGDQCPDSKNGNEDGLIEDSPDKFTYESWIREEKNREGQVSGHKFGRCIENKGNKELWTHWKGILSSGWIPKNDRKLFVTRRNSNASENKNKVLWYGDGRDKKKTVETECWKGEDACESPDAASRHPVFVQVGFQEQPDWASSESALLRALIGSQGAVSTYTYGEVFIPVDAKDPIHSLIRLDLSIVSTVTKDLAEYELFARIRKRDIDKRITPYLKHGAVPLFVVKIQDSFLADMFRGYQHRFTGPRLREVVNHPCKPALAGKTTVRRVKDYTFDSSKIEIMDITGEVNVFPMSLYKP